MFVELKSAIQWKEATLYMGLRSGFVAPFSIFIFVFTFTGGNHKTLLYISPRILIL
jgi:hypothetical protein